MQLRVHMRGRLCAYACNIGLAAALLLTNLARAQTNPPRVQLERLLEHGARIIVSGETQRFHRVDASTNFNTWRPLTVLTNTTGTKAYDDTNATGLPMRFYRAADVSPAAGVTSLSQQRGSAGERIEIFGQFFDGRPGDNGVRIGEVTARVLEADGTRLLIEVPTNASTGPLTVTTPSGETTVPQFFVVTAPALGTFAPPPGVNAAQYELVNPYRAATPLAAGNPTNEFLVRRGRPLLNLAVPTNGTDKTYFLAVTVSDGAPFVIDAASTAQALVFMSPLVQTRDPDMSAALLAIIAADPKVQLLASNIAAIYPLGGDPFANASFAQAYTDAVVSVAGGSPAQALAHRAKAASTPQASHVDLEYIELEHRRADVFAKGRKLNPVDWGLTLSRIKTIQAFPNGERDFRRALEFDRRFTNYPADVVQKFDINSDLAFERFDLVKALLKKLNEFVSPPGGQMLELTADDSIYVLRAIGPGVKDADEVAFVDEEFPNESTRVIAINLLNAVVDLLSLVLDEDTIKDLGGSVVVEIEKAVAREAVHIQSVGDFAKAAGSLAEKIMVAISVEQTKKALQASLPELLGKAAGAAAIEALAVLKLIGVPGKLAERLAGLYETTAMETAFIVTGNPFKLDIVSVSPTNVAAGEPLNVVIRGAHLNPNNEADVVGFSSYLFPGKILSVANLSQDQQRIMVEVPERLRTNELGPLLLEVVAQGRRGSTNFNLVRGAPVVQFINPSFGYAASSNYLGFPFPGTQVRLEGYYFGPTNTFLFGSVPATVVYGTEGNVSIFVPAGAVTGPITVRRVDSDGQMRDGLSAEFQVLGPPGIISNTPNAGFVGTGVRVLSTFVGFGPATLLFNGLEMGEVSFHGAVTNSEDFLSFATKFAAVIPSGTMTGPGELRVVTPAGQSAARIINIMEGPAPGGDVQVGGPWTEKFPPTTISPISLARAARLVATTNSILGKTACTNGEFCVDDEDYLYDGSGEIIRSLDPPEPGEVYEEGDFMTDRGRDGPPRFPIGASYADNVQILGTVTGGATFTTDHDRIGTPDGSFATISGSLTLSGNYNTLDHLVVNGSLTITGNENQVRFVIVNGALRIVGDHNDLTDMTVAFSPGPGVSIRGDHNHITVLATNNAGDGVVIERGDFNEVRAFSLAYQNHGNGFTVMGGAYGTRLAVGTSYPGAPPFSGNSSNGVAILDARSTAIFGTGLPIGGNGRNGVFLNSTNVSDTEMHSVIAEKNLGHGLYVGPGVRRTLLQPVIASRNEQNGILLENCLETTLTSVQALFNRNDGIVVSGVDDPQTTMDILTVGNTNRGLHLINGTSQLRCTGVNHLGFTAVTLEGTNVARNSISIQTDNCSGDGARLISAHDNNLVISAGKCAGNGLFVSGGELNLVTLSASNNTLAGARFTDGTRANTLLATVLSNNTGVVFANGANANLVQELHANANRFHGLRLTGTGTRNNRVLNAHVGLPITNPTNEPPGNAMDGIRIDSGASDNTLGSPNGLGPEVRNNGACGIRIAGMGTTNNMVLGALVAVGTDLTRRQPVGIIVEDHAADNTIDGSTNSFNLVNIHLRSGSTRTLIQHCRIDSSTGPGLLIEDSANNVIGSALENGGSDFLNNLASGIELTGDDAVFCTIRGNNISGSADGIFAHNEAHSNRIEAANTIYNNTTGVRVEGVVNTIVCESSINFNGTGIRCADGATETVIVGNTISQNGVGVVVDGLASDHNALRENVITANASKGISLLNFANDGIQPPVITGISSQSAMGTNSAPDGSTIEVFSDPQDEGAELLGSGHVYRGRFNVALKQPFRPTDVGFRFNLHATVTDTNGNTSEFGDYFAGGNADGGVQIAFASTRDGNSEVYLTDGSSAPPTRLTSDPASDHSPALSPDGASLAFVSTRTGNPEIFTLPLSNAASVLQLTANAAADYDPAWSPGGSNLVFVSERDGNAEIYRMHADGTGLTRLTFDAGTDRWPSYSPDGTKIVFASTRNGNFDLFVMDANGSNVTALAANSAADTRPVWSPDGALIAFVSDRDGNLEIYTVKPDGSQLTRLTTDPASETEPSWLPNGQMLVFSSNRDEGYELYTVPRAGGPAVRLTVSSGDNLHPSAARR